MEHQTLEIARHVVHYTLHFAAPGAIAWLFFRDRWKVAWLIMLATMLVDLDHLFAYPDVFVPERCSIGFHPLHSYWAVAAYLALCLFPRTRIVGIGLTFHMFTDTVDCLWIGW